LAYVLGRVNGSFSKEKLIFFETMEVEACFQLMSHCHLLYTWKTAPWEMHSVSAMQADSFPSEFALKSRKKSTNSQQTVTSKFHSLWRNRYFLSKWQYLMILNIVQKERTSDF